MKTPHEFYLETNRKWIDMDGVYGAQCVDLWKHFIGELGYPNSAKTIGGSGYAKEIWNRRKELGYMDYFIEIDVNHLQDGDWLIWGDSRYAPTSHVAMFRKYDSKTSVTILGQNQGTGSGGAKGLAANQISFPLEGVIGALRPKAYIQVAPTPQAPKQTVDQIAKDVIAGKYGNGSERKQRVEAAGYSYTDVQAKVNQLLGVVPQPQVDIDAIAKAVIRGDHGNGQARKNALVAKYGATVAAQIQAKVNQLLS